MGLLDNNSVLTTPKTGLEGSSFVPLISNNNFDAWQWDNNATGKRLALTFRDVFAWIASGTVADEGTALYLVKGKITDTPTKIEVNGTNFPGLRGSPKIVHIIACPCEFFRSTSDSYTNGKSALQGREYRVCVIFDNGQIYHNYPSCHDTYDFTVAEQYDTTLNLFFKFDESVVWDLAERRHPVKTNTGDDAALIASGAYYYNPALPNKCYEFHPALNAPNGYGNTVGFGATNSVNVASQGEDIGIRSRFWRSDMEDAAANSFDYMGGYIANELYTMVGTYRNNTNTACRICVFGTQDGGRNWYCMYEFASMDRLKYGEASYRAATGIKGAAISQDGDSVLEGVYKVKRRTLIVPYATAKEPSNNFEYDGEVNISSIIGANGVITVTTASAHGYSNGDAVVINFQDNVTANNRAFDWMVNGTADASSGGNGILFKVTAKTSTTFQVVLYIHNADNNLPARHVHSLNKCRDGIVIGTGENYPMGGWILYDAVKAADPYDKYNVANPSDNPIIRLNSTSVSAQRPVGCIITQEGEDTFVYFASDTTSITLPDVEMPEGRTQSFSHGSIGLWKIKLSEIDDLSKAVLVYPSIYVAFGFQVHDNVCVFYGENGNIAVSFDMCKTWESFRVPNDGKYRDNWGQHGCHFSGLANGKMLSLGNTLLQFKR